MKKDLSLVRLGLPFGLLVIAVGLIVWLTGSTLNEDNSTGRISVAASFYPYGEFARIVGGEYVTVRVITAPGSEPHDFEPSPQDILAVYRAKVFAYNGGGIDAWADRLEPDLADVQIVRGLASADILRTDPDDPKSSDPHVWLDPIIAQKIVEKIADALIAIDPAHQTTYTANSAAYQNELKALDQVYRTSLASCTKQAIVTAHAAFGYLTDRYHLLQIAISGLEEEEPSPAQLAKIAKVVKEQGIKYIFTETLTSPRLSETIAEEVGAETLVLNPLEGLTEAEAAAGANYLSVMNDNLAKLQTALDCQI